MYRLRLLVVCALVAFSTASGSAQLAPKAGRGASPVRASLPRVLPGTGESAFATIHGNALNANAVALPNSLVRLRDARYGRVIATQVTDRGGLFSFGGNDPGTYVVELIGKDQRVLAASELLNIEAGQVISAIVKLPFRLDPFGGIFGHTMGQALAVMSAAAASGVLVTSVTGVDASAR